MQRELLRNGVGRARWHLQERSQNCWLKMLSVAGVTKARLLALDPPLWLRQLHREDFNVFKGRAGILFTVLGTPNVVLGLCVRP